MPLGDLSRDELIRVVRRLQSELADEGEEDRLVALFNESVPHPRASDLIFYPEREFEEDRRDGERTAEEIVDRALAYKAIEL